MKKLYIMQIVLGVLVVVSFFVYVLILKTGYSTMEITDAEGNVLGFERILGIHELFLLLDILMMVYLAIGILATVCGIAQLVRTVRNSVSRAMSIVQVALGILVLASMLMFVIEAKFSWGISLPVYAELEGYSEATFLRYNPVLEIAYRVWIVISFMLGPAIAGSASVVLFRTKEEYS